MRRAWLAAAAAPVVVGMGLLGTLGADDTVTPPAADAASVAPDAERASDDGAARVTDRAPSGADRGAQVPDGRDPAAPPVGDAAAPAPAPEAPLPPGARAPPPAPPPAPPAPAPAPPRPAPPAPAPAPPAPSSATRDVESRLLAMANDARWSAGLAPVQAHDGLAAVARTWSEQLAASGRSLAHNPDYAAQVPGGWSALGENVAWIDDGGTLSPGDVAQRIHQGWMDSAGHRENLLRPGYTHLGVGVGHHPEHGWYLTQNFATY